jgi:acetolactate synthase-1/2/3 large subunit
MEGRGGPRLTDWKQTALPIQMNYMPKIHSVLDKPGPFVCEVIMPATQPLIPRVSSLKKPDGSIISKPIEDLYPFLDRKEFAENMIVDPVEILKID